MKAQLDDDGMAQSFPTSDKKDSYPGIGFNGAQDRNLVSSGKLCNPPQVLLSLRDRCAARADL